MSWEQYAGEGLVSSGIMIPLEFIAGVDMPVIREFVSFTGEPSQAELFARKIKEDHCLPSLDNIVIWKESGAQDIVLSYQSSGYYKITKVIFKDGSEYAN